MYAFPTMKRLLSSLLLLAAAPLLALPGAALPLQNVPATAPAVDGLDGDWSGILAAPAGNRHIIVHLHKTAGAWTCSLDSPDQGAMAVDCDIASLVNPVSFTVGLVNGTYVGTLAGTTITGTWSQGKAKLPLNLTRGAAATPAPAPAP